MSDSHAIDAQIRAILKDHAKLADDAANFPPENNLYQAGMTSLSSVDVMLALEDAFEIEFPDHMLNKHVFGSIAAMREAITELTAA